jgi:hypothetical protein
MTYWCELGEWSVWVAVPNGVPRSHSRGHQDTRRRMDIAIIPYIQSSLCPFFFFIIIPPIGPLLDLGENGTRSCHIGNVNH